MPNWSPLLSRAWVRLALGFPLMRPGEIRLFKRYIKGRGLMVEFGAGTSTLYALSQGVENLITVESDSGWIDLLRQNGCAEAEQSGRLRFVHIDTGPTAFMAKPRDASRADNWPRYSAEVWKLLPKKPDIVFVDGRFRVACALAAAHHCGEDTPVLVHDYRARDFYHVIGEHLALVESTGSLAVFRGYRRPASDIIAAAAAYAADPR